MHQIIVILTIAGTIGLFLFGMKLMSEALQKISGNLIRKELSSMSSNKLSGVITGIFITALIQSSSASTVMIVSFVNAGLIKLAEAISIIIGANIGTAFTTWLIAIFGFKLNIVAFTFPLIGISIPIIFSNKQKLKNVGETILGFAILFISIMFMKECIPQATSNDWLLIGINRFSSWGYTSFLIFFIIGIVFTVIIKSSSSIFALTLVLATNGWLNFEMSAAMIIGENLGTTLSAVLASKAGNNNARRAARVHFFFNLFGVIWVSAFFPFCMKGISHIYMFLGGGNPFTQTTAIPLALALFHTLFNVVNAALLIGFTKQISNYISKKVPALPNNDSEFKLTYIKIGVLSTPDASLYQARRETVLFAEKVRKMFMTVEHLFDERTEKKFEELKENIQSTENFANRLEKEIASFLTKVGEGRLSENSSQRLRALYKMIDDIESIADSCVNLTNAINKKREAHIEFPVQVHNNIHLMFNMVRDSLDIMVTMLTHNEEMPLSMAQETEREINNFRDILKSEHLDNLERGIYKYDAGILYNDIISQCERIGDYSINVDEAFKGLFA